MNRTLVSLVAAAALTLSFSAHALVVTVDMTGESTGTCGATGGTYATSPLSLGNGYEVVGFSGDTGICDVSLFIGGGLNESLYADGADSFTLKRTDGAAFSLISFDVLTAGSEIIDVTGDGGGLNSVVSPGGASFTTISSITDVSDVVGVTFSFVSATFFDNFVVESASTNVSEPGSVAMLGLGLGLLGLRLRRRNSANV